jgi:hypothetical protein
MREWEHTVKAVTPNVKSGRIIFGKTSESKKGKDLRRSSFF